MGIMALLFVHALAWTALYTTCAFPVHVVLVKTGAPKWAHGLFGAACLSLPLPAEAAGFSQELASSWGGLICLFVGLGALGRMVAFMWEDDLIREGLLHLRRHNMMLAEKAAVPPHCALKAVGRAAEAAAEAAVNEVKAAALVLKNRLEESEAEVKRLKARLAELEGDNSAPSWWADELSDWDGDDESVVVKGELVVDGGRVEFRPKKTVQASPPSMNPSVVDPHACIKQDLSSVLDEIVEMWDRQIEAEEEAAREAVLDEYEEELDRLEKDLRKATLFAAAGFFERFNLPHPNQRLSADAWLAKWTDVK